MNKTRWNTLLFGSHTIGWVEKVIFVCISSSRWGSSTPNFHTRLRHSGWDSCLSWSRKVCLSSGAGRCCEILNYGLAKGKVSFLSKISNTSLQITPVVRRFTRTTTLDFVYCDKFYYIWGTFAYHAFHDANRICFGVNTFILIFTYLCIFSRIKWRKHVGF